MGANDPRGWAIFDPRGMIGRIYKKDHYTLLHTKYEGSGPCGFGEDFFMFCPIRSGTCGFGEEDFFYVFPIVSLWELSVAMETRVPIRRGPKPSVRNKQLPDCPTRVEIVSGNLRLPVACPTDNLKIWSVFRHVLVRNVRREKKSSRLNQKF